jgi:membrane protein YqaA with SNARE-associated domain
MKSSMSLTAFGGSLMTWLLHFGGGGLILIGLLDNSAIPLPGGMDLLTTWLAAGRVHPWFYYAILATMGSAIGGYSTYRIGKKGGKALLQKKLPKRRVQTAAKRFDRWAFGSIFMATLIPPPFPIAAAWLTAGAMEYSWERFLCALLLGRFLRYSIIAYFASKYGTFVLSLFSRYYKPALVVLLCCSFIGGLYALRRYRELRRERQRQDRKSVPSLGMSESD